MPDDKKTYAPGAAGSGAAHTYPRRWFLRTAFATFMLGTRSGDVLAALDVISKTYQTPEAFLAEAFGAAVPPPQMLELDDAKQAQISAALGRRYPQARLRYWRANGRSAWILDDKGKEGYQLTTAGFVVKERAIDFARVLIYRESRGEQVAEPSFLKQLAGVHAAGAELDRKVDNISGATLSVKMMQRMARTALTLDSLVS